MGAFLLLGLIQGLTEFLPISSSGHLVLSQQWLGVRAPGLLFDAMVHLGAVGSVLVYFRATVWERVRHPLSAPSLLLWKGILLAMVPTIAIGLGMKGSIELAFETPTLVAAGLLWTGLVLLVVGRAPAERRGLGGLRWWHFMVIGFAQGLAIFPGVSRSGMTIAAALLVGLKREQAAEFSFFLAIPAILGATGMQLLGASENWGAHQALWGSYLAGTLIAFVSGTLAIGLLLRVLHQGNLHRFAYYCWALGASVLIWSWLNGGA